MYCHTSKYLKPVNLEVKLDVGLFMDKSLVIVCHLKNEQFLITKHGIFNLFAAGG